MTMHAKSVSCPQRLLKFSNLCGHETGVLCMVGNYICVHTWLYHIWKSTKCSDYKILATIDYYIDSYLWYKLNFQSKQCILISYSVLFYCLTPTTMTYKPWLCHCIIESKIWHFSTCCIHAMNFKCDVICMTSWKYKATSVTYQQR